MSEPTPIPTPETFGAWLRQRRAELGLRQADVADLVGVSVSSAQKWELPEPHRRRPRLPVIRQVVAVLDQVEA